MQQIAQQLGAVRIGHRRALERTQLYDVVEHPLERATEQRLD
ncbi:MAG: hypothetical protein RL721_2316, partial [Candidatus Eisenbacteria bacterium]